MARVRFEYEPVHSGQKIVSLMTGLCRQRTYKTGEKFNPRLSGENVYWTHQDWKDVPLSRYPGLIIGKSGGKARKNAPLLVSVKISGMKKETQFSVGCLEAIASVLEEKFGCNLVSWQMHHDQEASHIHAQIIPLANGKLSMVACFSGKEKKSLKEACEAACAQYADALVSKENVAEGAPEDFFQEVRSELTELRKLLVESLEASRKEIEKWKRDAMRERDIRVASNFMRMLISGKKATLPPTGNYTGPERKDENLSRVAEWLLNVLGISRQTVDWLISSGQIYADAKQNIVLRRVNGGCYLKGTMDVKDGVNEWEATHGNESGGHAELVGKNARKDAPVFLCAGIPESLRLLDNNQNAVIYVVGAKRSVEDGDIFPLLPPMRATYLRFTEKYRNIHDYCKRLFPEATDLSEQNQPSP